MDVDPAAQLETAPAGLRHDRHGYYGALLRDQLLDALPKEQGTAGPLDYRLLPFVDAEPTGGHLSHVAELLLYDRACASRVVHRLVDAGSTKSGHRPAGVLALPLAKRQRSLVTRGSSRRGLRDLWS